MRLIASLPALYVFSLVVDSPKRTTRFLQPTRLEAFAGRTTTKITWSKEVGRIDSPEVHAVVTALVVEGQVQSLHRMRGIRIDLASPIAADQIYLDDAGMEAVKRL